MGSGSLVVSGTTGDAVEVVIDGSGPNGSVFALGLGQGNARIVRIGLGHETVEWLTVMGGTNAAGGIVADLLGNPTTTLRIAHVIATGSIRGIDVRNMGPASAGRTIIIDLDHNELTANTASNGQGIRFVNANGANAAVIFASLQGNRSHDNLRGCLAANLASSGAAVLIDSHDDQFDDNRVGCVVFGGITQTAADVANDNVVTFTVHGGSFADNVGVLQPYNEMGGLVVVGGQGQVAGATSRNSVRLSVWGTRFDANQNADVRRGERGRTPRCQPGRTTSCSSN